MTPKEKAEELYTHMFECVINPELTVLEMEAMAIHCALIAIDEMIKMYNEMNVNGFLKPNSVGFILNDVKKEIENL